MRQPSAGRAPNRGIPTHICVPQKSPRCFRVHFSSRESHKQNHMSRSRVLTIRTATQQPTSNAKTPHCKNFPTWPHQTVIDTLAQLNQSDIDANNASSRNPSTCARAARKGAGESAASQSTTRRSFGETLRWCKNTSGRNLSSVSTHSASEATVVKSEL